MWWKLNLPDGIEEIESRCFYNCRYLYGKLILPSHLKKLGSDAFAKCSGLKGDLVIPKSLTVIPSDAFNACGLGGRLQFEEGIEETVKWYLDNQEWMDNVTSGDYQKYYDNMYSNR